MTRMSSDAKIHASFVLAGERKLITMVLSGFPCVREQQTSYLVTMTCVQLYIAEENKLL